MIGSALVLVLAASTAWGENIADAMVLSRQLLDSLSNTASTERFAQVAREYGQIVDRARQEKLNREQLNGLLEITDKMRERTSERLRAAEAATGESEGALEALYQSVIWDDLSFALAAFPYWQAWIELEISKRIADDGLKAEWIWRAKRAFQSTSVQVFRPSLIYGGWLGLGYVAIAEGRDDRAIEIFESLESAISIESEHPLQAVVALELRLLRAKRGDVKHATITGDIDADEALLLKAEAFALLERHRTTQSGAGGAAERLRSVIAAGYLDDQLLAQILHYRAEIVAHDIGPYTDLAGAEFAFEYGHYYDAVRKFKAFFTNVEAPPDLDLDPYRYRFALACYKAALFDDAAFISERLLRKRDLDKELKRSAIKLSYAARASHKGKPTEAQRKALKEAAQRFIAANPNDKDADSARLLIARHARDSKSAISVLQGIHDKSRFRTGVAQTTFYVVARDFAKAVQSGHQGQLKALAGRGIDAARQLPRKQQKDQYTRAIVLQMRSLVDPDPATVLQAIDGFEQKEDVSLITRRALLWARLKCFQRIGGEASLLAYLREQAKVGIESYHLEQIYPLVRDMQNPQDRITAATIVRPALADSPSMDRRFRILVAEGYLQLGNGEAALGEAKQFLDDYPKAGDAWRLYALAAAATDKPIEADRAWSVITKKSDPRRDVWWESMIQRIEIRANSTRPKSACDVVAEMTAKRSLMPEGMASKVAAAGESVACGPATAG